MNKRIKTLGALLCATPLLFAQQVVQESKDSVQNEFREDNATFIFSEDQLGEDDDAANVSSLITGQNDPYRSKVGFLFSPMRFKLRAMDSQYDNNYMNGVMMNNLENGRFSFSSMTGGLNDATRNKEGVNSYDQNNFGFVGVNGGSNIDLRASHYAAGHKLGIALTNRNYVARGMYTYASGVLNNGWSFMGSVGYRWAKEGVIEGTFYNSLSYMLGAEKFLSDKHHLSFVTWGSPTERAQQGAATDEVYWLANNRFYNPYWGYQNGEKRNSRVVRDYSPNAMLTWDYLINERTKLSTNAAVTYTMYSSTALNYNNAYNPIPTYYKNLPSSVFNVYNDAYNNPEWLQANPGVLDQYNSLYNYWTGCKANRQVQWDRIYAQNEAANAAGEDALIYQERRHNDQFVVRLNTIFDKILNRSHHYTLGLNVNHTLGMHYKTMADLLGSNKFTDYDSYSLSDYGRHSQEIQNDLDNPDRVINVGDKFGYNYNIEVDKAQAWGQYTLTAGHFSMTAGADINGTTIEREGLMRNGRAAEYSKGYSGQARFLGGSGRLQLNYELFGMSMLSIAGQASSNAPLAYNSFVAPRINNNFVNNLKNEKVYSVEASYRFNLSWLSGRVGAYYTLLDDMTRQSAFYNDDAGHFTYLTMTEGRQEYKGVEAALVFKLTNNLKINMVGTISDAKYINNPLAQLAYEGSNAETNKAINTWTNPVTQDAMDRPLQVNYDGMREGSTPLTAASIGVDYNINGWYFSVNLNYYDRIYLSASPYTRLSNVLDNASSNSTTYYTTDQVIYNIDGSVKTAYDMARENGGNVYAKGEQGVADGTLMASYSPEQSKGHGGFMLDASIGKSIRLKGGKRLSINLQLVNLTNNTNICTGGYEQNRNDRSEYQFSKNPYKFYANAINGFLNMSLKF